MIEQGTEEWRLRRLGKVTASRMADLMAKTKSGYGASRANYMAELLVERLTGKPKDGFVSPAMAHGTAYEDEARASYEFQSGNSVQMVGFIDHPMIEKSGASPDGYVSDAGMIEIKCPQPATHLDTLLSGKVPNKYVLQMQWQMACAGRDWCDFVSYQPDLSEAGMGLFIHRVNFDGDCIKEIESEVRGFLAELAAKEKALREKFAPIMEAA